METKNGEAGLAPTSQAEAAPRVGPLQHSADIDQIVAALSAAQGAMKPAERDADNPYFRSTYNTLASSWESARHALRDNNLAVIQGPGEVEIVPDEQASGQRGKVKVTTMLAHKSGQFFKVTVELPIIAMRAKKKQGEELDNDAERAPGRITPQAVGSAITYARRYGFDALVGVAPEADDDDGNAGSGGGQQVAASTIPVDGVFEDAVVAVKWETKKKRDGQGTFQLAKVETAQHGGVDAYEETGKVLEKLAGTGQAVRFQCEKRGNYGWQVKTAKPVAAPTVGQDAAAPKAVDVSEREVAMFEGAPEASVEIAVWRWVEDKVQAITTLPDLVIFKAGCVRRGSPFFTDSSKAAFQKRHEELKPKPGVAPENKVGTP